MLPRSDRVTAPALSAPEVARQVTDLLGDIDRRSTRLNSSHVSTRRYTLFRDTTLFRSHVRFGDVASFGQGHGSRVVCSGGGAPGDRLVRGHRSEEHTSELQSRIDTSLHTLPRHDALPLSREVR